VKHFSGPGVQVSVYGLTSPLNTEQVISETSLSRQSIALVVWYWQNTTHTLNSKQKHRKLP